MLHVADALNDDIAATPPEALLREVTEDSGDHQALAAQFDRIVESNIARAGMLADWPARSILARRRPTVAIGSQGRAAAVAPEPVVAAARTPASEMAQRGGRAVGRQGSLLGEVIPALFGRLVVASRPRITMGAFATVVLVAILAPGLYEHFVDRSAGLLPSALPPIGTQDESRVTVAAPLPSGIGTASEDPGNVRPTDLDTAPKLPRFSLFPTTTPGLALRQPQNPAPDALPSMTSSAQPRVADGADLTDKPWPIVTQSGDVTVCFFIAPASVDQGRAVLDGYGSSVLPFTIFEREFTRQTGLEALTRQHVVTTAQCAAVDFLYGLRNSAPSLHINAEYVNSGTVLSGTVANFGDRTLQVLLVGDDGNVQELSSLLKVSERNSSFNLRMFRNSLGPAQPQLLIALASSQAGRRAKGRGCVGAADRLFARVLGEAQGSGNKLNVAVAYLD
jgi:hypothetical protein